MGWAPTARKRSRPAATLSPSPSLADCLPWPMTGSPARRTMRRPVFALLLVLLAAGPAAAKVLAEGAARNGFYWQKVQYDSGKIRYLCRSTTDAKIQKHANCNQAGAQRPE